MRTAGRDGDLTADRLLDTDEVAEYLGIPPNSLKMWRYRRTGPPWLKLGRHVRYRLTAIEQWLDDQENQVGAGGREHGTHNQAW
jgi:predicted DNA-binding transcriptional regulator AlpA